MGRNPFYDQVDARWFQYETDAEVQAAARFPAAFTPAQPNFEHPRNGTPGWSESAQGVTHDDDNWYFTQEKALWRIPRTRDLAMDVAGDVLRVGIPAEIDGQGGNHFGDLDCYRGRLYLPLEGAAVAQLVVFEAPSLEYRPLFTTSLAQGDSCPWCAIDRRSGLLFSSRFEIDEEGLYAYSVEVSEDNGVDATFVGRFPLFDAEGAPMRVSKVQGGVFSPEGHLYLVSDAGVGVLGFDMYTGRLGTRLSIEYNPAKHLGLTTYQELEGLTLWDMDDGAAPGIGGQLHVLMIDNAPLGEDRIYFKHYAVLGTDEGAL